MQTIPNAIPITKVKSDPSGVLTMIKSGPVVLTNRGSSTAVLISLTEWNQIATRLARFERQARADAVELRNDFVSYEYANAD